MSAVKEGWDALHERIKELEEYGRRWLKNHDIQMQRAIAAEALIKEIGELLVSLKRRRPPASQCIDELQAKLKEHGYG